MDNYIQTDINKGIHNKADLDTSRKEKQNCFIQRSINKSIDIPLLQLEELKNSLNEILKQPKHKIKRNENIPVIESNLPSEKKTITTVLGIPEMFDKREHRFEIFLTKVANENKAKENINTISNCNNQTDADSLYKINIRNLTIGREQEDKVIPEDKYSSFFNM